MFLLIYFKTYQHIIRIGCIILGSALDLIAGATHSSEEIYKLKNKSKLIETYKHMRQKGDIKNYLTYNISEK